MTGSASPGERAISQISLALFADSGWYEVNLSLAEPIGWGHSAGCDFATEPCDQWTEPRYLCDQSAAYGYGGAACSYDRRAKAYCDVARYVLPLPEGMRHFEDARRGGYSELLDYCPVYRPFEDGHCAQPRAAPGRVRSGGQGEGASWEEQCRALHGRYMAVTWPLHDLLGGTMPCAWPPHQSTPSTPRPSGHPPAPSAHTASPM